MATGLPRFSDVQHQPRAISILRRALRSGRTHHAYLLAGPEGVGKELAGRALAGRLLCLRDDLPPDGDACGACSSCQLMASGNHPDFHLIHRGLHALHPERSVRASKGLFLGIDLIRHFLIERTATRPMQGRRRVFLVRDAERMNEEAQNALLKTLEEPPGQACLILVSSSASRLLSTIRSRCQLMPFGLLPTAFVQQELTRRKVPAADALALAQLSDGRLGAALRWQAIGMLTALAETGDLLQRDGAAQPEAFAKAIVEIGTGLADRASRAEEASTAEPEDDDGEPESTPEPDESAEKSGKLGTDELRNGVKLALLLVAAIHRAALVAQADPEQAVQLPQVVRAVQFLRDEFDADQLSSAIEAVAATEQMIDRNVALQLACERLAAAMIGAIV